MISFEATCSSTCVRFLFIRLGCNNRYNESGETSIITRKKPYEYINMYLLYFDMKNIHLIWLDRRRDPGHLLHIDDTLPLKCSMNERIPSIFYFLSSIKKKEDIATLKKWGAYSKLATTTTMAIEIAGFFLPRSKP